MRSRATAIGAVLRVEPVVGGGVCIALEWQVKRARHGPRLTQCDRLSTDEIKVRLMRIEQLLAPAALRSTVATTSSFWTTNDVRRKACACLRTWSSAARVRSRAIVASICQAPAGTQLRHGPALA